MKIKDFCMRFCKNGNVDDGPSVKRLTISSSAQPHISNDNGRTIWLEYILEDGRFGLVYDIEDNKTSSWFMVDVSNGIRSCSGYIDDENTMRLSIWVNHEEELTESPVPIYGACPVREDL